MLVGLSGKLTFHGRNSILKPQTQCERQHGTTAKRQAHIDLHHTCQVQVESDLVDIDQNIDMSFKSVLP